MISVSSLKMSTTFEYRDLMDRQARRTRMVMEAERGRRSLSGQQTSHFHSGQRRVFRAVEEQMQHIMEP